MNAYDFRERLAYSVGVVGRDCEETILSLLTGCVYVVKTDTSKDRSGIDYIAKLRGGAEVGIDHKVREKGCARYWRDGEPELALETYSVVPVNGQPGKTGWTLDESKQTDYTLHTFDPTDSVFCYLLPFQLLRVAFREHIREWRSKYPCYEQQSYDGDLTWRSQAVFVPVRVVLAAIALEMTWRHGNVRPEQEQLLLAFQDPTGAAP